MTSVMLLSAKVRRNKWLRQTLDIGNMRGPIFGFKHSRNKTTKKCVILLISIFLHEIKFALPYTSPDWASLLYSPNIVFTFLGELGYSSTSLI